MEIFTIHCPTKDKTVSLSVAYSKSSLLENSILSKGRICSCTGWDVERCRNCSSYNSLPETLHA